MMLQQLIKYQVLLLSIFLFSCKGQNNPEDKSNKVNNQSSISSNAPGMVHITPAAGIGLDKKHTKYFSGQSGQLLVWHKCNGCLSL
jgi:hypothetical protein